MFLGQFDFVQMMLLILTPLNYGTKALRSSPYFVFFVFRNPANGKAVLEVGRCYISEPVIFYYLSTGTS